MRDDYRCQYCGVPFKSKELTFDHVIPRREKGRTEWKNIVAACYPCNQRKAHHGHMKPLKHPYHPSYWELAAICKTHPLTVPHEPWLQYICWGGKTTVNTNLANINVTDDEASNYRFDDLSNV